MCAVHAAAAPLISEKGGRVYDKFRDAMMRIIRPQPQLTLFERLKEIALRRKAERELRKQAA